MSETTVIPFTRPTTTATGPSLQPPLKRCAIIGTAPSWKHCPWADTTLECWGLNDGYLLGVPRADRWYDLHPTHQMDFRPTGQRHVQATEARLGTYLRPEGHLSWLQTRPFPVYLQQARADWPTSRTFPKEEILAAFAPVWPLRSSKQGVVTPGPDYEVSTPAWMLMHAIVEGFTEISVWGIHLATAWEYQMQRPNFEWLLGVAAGRGIKIVLPTTTPLCRSAYQYAYAPKADLPLQLAQQRIDRIKAEGLRVRQQRLSQPWHAVPLKRDLDARLAALDTELLDARGTLQRAQLAQSAAG